MRAIAWIASTDLSVSVAKVTTDHDAKSISTSATRAHAIRTRPARTCLEPTVANAKLVLLVYTVIMILIIVPQATHARTVDFVWTVKPTTVVIAGNTIFFS